MKKPIEFIDLKAQAAVLGDDIKLSMDKVLSHGRFIMGPEVYELEKKLSDFTGAKYVTSCASGTDALLMALMAMDIGPGHAVLTSPFTFIATAEVICLLGAVPVFVDIDENTFNLDPEKFEKTIEDFHVNPRHSGLMPKCVIPVDIFGLPADYKAINEIAHHHRLKVIEDAAQSLGSRSGEKMAGNLADMAATSFFPAKPLGCYGDGGAIFTNDESLNEKLVSIRVHGMGCHKYENIRIGINGRLDTLQAAILISKLKIFESELKKREKIALKYREKLDGIVRFQKIPGNCTSSWAQFSFLCQDRNSLITKLDSQQIPSAVYYPKPLHLQTAFSLLNYKKGDFPVAEAVSETILSIPMHPYLSDEEIDYITETIQNSLRN